MKRTAFIQVALGVIVICVLALKPEARHSSYAYTFQQDTTQQDTTKSDTLQLPYSPTKQPTYTPTYRFGDPFSNRMSSSPLLLADPSAIDLQVDFDSSVSYSVYERIGDVNFRPVTTMSFEEYDTYNDRQITKEYFKEVSGGLEGESAVSGRSLIPRLYISPVFDRLFGGSYVDIQPNGFVNLDFGGRWQRVDNPAIPIRQQRNGGFNFDQQISLNLVGKIGEKLAVTANFDNNNSFDFQNNLKVEYTGYEEDIVKKIEIGNVSMPVSNSLMTGAQSLFGVKTQLQFGRLFLTGVASRQQGQSEVLTIGGDGAGSTEFSIQASDYDENRHFWLGHFFRDNYEKWLSILPQINSGVAINRIEVYVVNRNNDTKSTREVLALMDLGEGSRVYSPAIGDKQSGMPTDNGANGLYNSIKGMSRLNSDVKGELESRFGTEFKDGTDYVKMGTARKLDNDEYIIDEQLGYISLLRNLSNDEFLAVSFEYSYNGQVYKVGELTTDYQQYGDDEVIIMKMLRPNKINSSVPTWDLMMKNIYNLRASQVQKEGFTLRVHYRDDASGIDNPSLHEGRRTKDQPLIELLGMDQLNMNGDRQRDGNFDFIPGVTIDTRNARVIFPVREPFGATLEKYFDDDERSLKEKYVFDTLYRSTKAIAERELSKNKFFIQGKYNSSGSSSKYTLPGINISEGSVVVTAGGTPLTEGLDYSVNYNLGEVTIINDQILQSGKTINIAYEKADLFNFQSRWLYGVRADYQFNDNFNIGATLLKLNERPGGISRYTIGDEPTSNSKYGFDINWQDEVPFLTKAMDFLPLVSTKETSTVSFQGEFAQMKPGTSNLVNGQGTSYIDDFENAVIPINLSGWTGWKLASTPETNDRRFDLSSQTGSALGENYRRAKISWYSVDQSVFYRSGGNNKPSNIEDDDLKNHYVRPVLPQEIFRQRTRDVIIVPENIFDIAYYPSERGQYNYNPNLDRQGRLSEPEQNYGGITRAITNEIDFYKTNVQYLEFWMMDPFIDGERGRSKAFEAGGYPPLSNNDGGELIFNLGSVSEDIVPDGAHAFESGLPSDGELAKARDTQAWGYVPDEPFLTNNFADRGGGLANQDVGLEGLSDENELTYFENSFINQLSGVSPDALDQIRNDPSADNFNYFLGPEMDQRDMQIIERYKNWNGLDGNSNPNFNNGQPQSSTVYPDNEDVNNDQTLSDVEEYYEYKLSLRPGELEIGKNYIVDAISDQTGEATWYLFRIPIRNPDAYTAYGGIEGFQNIKYVRMYATNFSEPVIFRMAKLQLVGAQWWKYDQSSLLESGLYEIPEEYDTDLTVSVVSIEENSEGTDGKTPYVLPPGIDRDQDNTTIVNRQINEQSLQVCVDELEDQNAKAVWKELSPSMSLINYGRMQMFFHGEAYNDDVVADDEVTAFLRFGTDPSSQYYEIEVPLKITPKGLTETGNALKRAVWPLENELDISLNELLGLKAERNRNDIDVQIPYTQPSNDGKYQLTVKGNPDMSTIMYYMIGVRNPKSADGSTKSVCIWANELRVTDFDTRKGWAANALMSVKLADVAKISASTNYTSIGFGGLQSTIQQRSQEESISYDVSAQVSIDKFLLPEKTGLKIPMYVSMEKSRVKPQYDPLDPDTPLEASLEAMDSDEERSKYRRLVEDRSERRSLNFTNVHKQKVNKEATPHFFDISNFSFSYAYSDVHSSSVNMQQYIQKSVNGGVSYNYSFPNFSIEPFKNVEFLSSPYFKLIKDINFAPLPQSVSARGDLNRNFRMTQLYNQDLTIDGVDPYFEKLFTFNRNYSLRWSPFKSLSLDFNAKANAVIDEIDSITPVSGDIDTQAEREYIWNEIKNLGRMKNYNHGVSATYKTPLDKFPVTDWLSADIRFSTDYMWTAGSLVSDPDLFFGNTIENKRDQQLSGRIDMLKLYNKVKFLKQINSPPRKKKGDEDESSFNPAHAFLRLLMSLRNINVTYNIREATTLTGFDKSAYMFGLDSGFNAPGWQFAFLGSQDAGIRNRAAENGWLIENPSLTAPFRQTYSEDLGFKASFEPLKDFKIQLDAKRTNTSSYSEIFRYDTLVSDFSSLTPTRKGSYSISFMTIQTAFEKQGAGYSSDAFTSFVRNIEEVRVRQNTLNTEPGFYDSLSQDVLVPAFIAAYTGQSAGTISLSPFPKIPIPSWRIDYNGLSKIPALAEIFSSISISHGYRSVFNISDYTNNITDYSDLTGQDFGVTLNNNIMNYPTATDTTETGRYAPVYNLNQVMISEQFAPLIGINIRTKNNLTTRMEYKKERSLSLNMANAQIQETTSQDFTFDFSYAKDEFKVPFKIKGRIVTLENQVTMRLSMTLRDALSIQRKLEGESKPVNGQTNLQIRPSMTYKLSQSLDLTAYFDRSVSEPKISGFKTANTQFGVQLRFALAQ